jgi:hypothetical protein
MHGRFVALVPWLNVRSLDRSSTSNHARGKALVPSIADTDEIVHRGTIVLDILQPSKSLKDRIVHTGRR